MRWVRPRSTVAHSSAGDDARQQVVGEDALGAFIAAVDGEGDALVEKGEVGGLFAALEFFWREGGEVFEERLIVAVTRVSRASNISS